MNSADYWVVTELGSGLVLPCQGKFSLTLPPVADDTYHDAQISDYAARVDFRNEPPLRLSVRARATGELRGTAGFGFWNHAFLPGQRSYRPPQAIWFFFASRPSNIALAKDIAGFGWKAATVNAMNWRFLGLLPLAPIGFLLMRNRALYNQLWSRGQQIIGSNEALLETKLLDEFRTYTIDWRVDDAVFSVDGDVVLRAKNVTSSRLGFIAWIDNQFAVATPQGQFGWGLLDVPQEQSLHLRDLQITPLP